MSERASEQSGYDLAKRVKFLSANKLSIMVTWNWKKSVLLDSYWKKITNKRLQLSSSRPFQENTFDILGHARKDLKWS